MIRVSGIVGPYGGRNEPWKKYQQITLESAEAFTIVEVEETTKNADVESPKRTEDADKNWSGHLKGDGVGCSLLGIKFKSGTQIVSFDSKDEVDKTSWLAASWSIEK